jgi:selenocysteine lyase/cysteine desulfurase
VTVYGTLDARKQTATVSFTVREMAPSEAGLRLDDEYGIMCRVGLHCSPAAHTTIGTFPSGTVRFGLGATTTAADVDAALRAVSHLAGECA